MPIVPILILFPVAVALILLLSKNVRLSSWVCYVGAAVIAGVTGLLVVASIAEGFMPISLFVETKLRNYIWNQVLCSTLPPTTIRHPIPLLLNEEQNIYNCNLRDQQVVPV